MKSDFMSKEGREIICLDPRTKILLVITITTVLVSGGDTGIMQFLKPVLTFVPLFLLFSSHQYKVATLFMIIYSLAYVARIYLIPITTGALNFCIVACCGIFFRFLPCVMMGTYLVNSTKVSEFMSAMERMHVSSKISIPLSVMFRFFPTVSEEHSAISDAMRMRGIKFGSGKILEYRFVPLMMSCVKIGDELSAAALVRGLGAPQKRTNICKIGFKINDICCFILCFVAFLIFSLYHFQII